VKRSVVSIEVEFIILRAIYFAAILLCWKGHLRGPCPEKASSHSPNSPEKKTPRTPKKAQLENFRANVGHFGPYAI